VRRAPSMQKDPLLAALRAVQCQDIDVCSMKQVCVQAYEEHVASVQSQRTVSRAMAPKAGPQDRAAAELLAQAKEQLTRSRDLMSRCLASQGELKRRYNL
jgi:hypothetical protein